MDFLTEIYKNKMETFTACRICLNTDVKLYNMSQYRLKSIYEELCGSNTSQIDDMPDHVCSYCASSLNKFASFKEKCKQSKHLMEFLIAEPKHLNADHLSHINTIKSNITLPYTFQKLYNFDSTMTTDIKEECFNNHDTKSDVTSEITNDFDNKEFLEDYASINDSDDEPLSKIVREGQRSKKDKLNENNSSDPRIKLESTFVRDNDESEKVWDVDIERTLTGLKSNNVHDILTELENKDESSGMVYESFEYDLVLLTKEQQIEEVLARKKTSNYLNSRYKCQYCYKGFMTDLTYKNHMVRHDKSAGEFPCAVCGARWADARTRRAHEAAAHERHYLCKMCPHTAKSHHKAKEHLQWHRGFLFACQICGASFKKNTTYLTHIRLQHPTTTTCAVCGAACLGKVGLNMHMKKAHKNTDWNIKYLECNICCSKFRNEDALKRHQKSADNRICDTKLRELQCEYCGDGFLDAEPFNEHLEMHRRVSRTCSECSRTFASERSLAAHQSRAHRTGEPRARPAADPALAPALTPAAAARTVCEICGYTCISRASLVYHQRTHTGEKPFECTLCKKRFSVYQRLQIHIRTHTGERPFKCAACPKAFKHKAALNRHDRVHTGARPYRCATCGKTFSQSNSMKQHAASVHLKAPLYARKTKQNKP